MCGLVGVFQRPGNRVESDVLTRMADVIRHRGPDDEGQWIDGPVGLHHLRLSVIDLATGHQPMHSGPAVIAFNGEIYNYVELREELKSLGCQFQTASDTEVILQGYLQHGPAFVERLNGMFAFLLVDRARGIAVAARDHFGIKPLYLHATPERLLFASEIKALLRHPDVRAQPDAAAVRDYLTFQFCLSDATLFDGVVKVRPGHYLTIDLGDLTVRDTLYWEPRFQVDTYHTEEYFKDRIRETIADSVRLQMRSDVPVGTYLSGGTDSSLVTMLAARYAGEPLKTFTGAFAEGPEFDESEYARVAADACGATSFVIHPTEQEFVDLMPHLAWHMDEPAAGPGLFPQYIVSGFARKQVTVALGGQGGDEIFGGYARYVVAYLEQAIKGAIFENNEEGEHIVSLKSILPNLPYLKQYVPMLREFWSEGAFEPQDRRYFRLVDRSGGMVSLFTDDFRAAFDHEGTFARFQSVFNHPDTQSFFNRMTHFDMVSSLPALLHVEDRVSMAHSLESRVPLLDHRLVDLVTCMPPAMKFKGAEMKYVLKKAIGDIVPARILARKEKMGFPVPLHLWARNKARDLFADVLLSDRCRQRGLFDTTAVEGLLDREHAFGRRLWGLLNLELWYRTFIDAP